MLAKVLSSAVIGIDAYLVEVEVDIPEGFIGTVLGQVQIGKGAPRRAAFAGGDLLGEQRGEDPGSDQQSAEVPANSRPRTSAGAAGLTYVDVAHTNTKPRGETHDERRRAERAEHDRGQRPRGQTHSHHGVE